MTSAFIAPTLDQVRKRLLGIYTAKGVEIWLDSPHKMLGGRRARDVVAEGRGEEVLVLIEQMETGAFI